MSYTWEQVTTGIDVANEAREKKKERERIQQKADDEANLARWWKLGANILGYIIPGGGPLLSFALGKAAEYGVDYAYDWESETVDPGKFHREDTIDFNKSLAEAAEDQDQGHMVNFLVDLGKMWVQSGGLTAKPGEWDPTTFGSGGVEGGEWSTYGRGTPPIDIKALGDQDILYDKLYRSGINAPGGIIPGSEDYIPGAWTKGGGLIKNIVSTGSTLGTAYAQDISIQSIYDEWQASKEADKKVKG